MSTKPEFMVFEVFIQSSHSTAHEHVGSVLAPTAQMALLLARENFLRRGKSISIWVVPRSALHGVNMAEDPDFFTLDAFDRGYREAAGYPENARRWQKYRRRALTIEELVKD